VEDLLELVPPLFLACAKAHLDIAQWLRGMHECPLFLDDDAAPASPPTALLFALKEGCDDSEMISWLFNAFSFIPRFAKTHSTHSCYSSYLESAIAGGRMGVVDFIMKKVEFSYLSSLSVVTAIQFRRWEILEWLIPMGARFHGNFHPSKKTTPAPLSTIVKYNREAEFLSLIDRRVLSIDELWDGEPSLLYAAVNSGCLTLCKELCARGADPWQFFRESELLCRSPALLAGTLELIPILNYFFTDQFSSLYDREFLLTKLFNVAMAEEKFALFNWLVETMRLRITKPTSDGSLELADVANSIILSKDCLLSLFDKFGEKVFPCSFLTLAGNRPSFLFAFAASCPNKSDLERVLRMHPNPAATWSNGRGVLHFLALRPSLELFLTCVNEFSLDPLATDNSGNNILHCTVFEEKPLVGDEWLGEEDAEFISYVVEKYPALVRHKNSFGDTPFDLAMKSEPIRSAYCESLLPYALRPHAHEFIDPWAYLPVVTTQPHYCENDVLILLLCAIAGYGSRNKQYADRTPIHYIAETGCVSLLQQAIADGGDLIDLESVSMHGETLGSLMLPVADDVLAFDKIVPLSKIITPKLLRSLCSRIEDLCDNDGLNYDFQITTEMHRLFIAQHALFVKFGFNKDSSSRKIILPKVVRLFEPETVSAAIQSYLEIYNVQSCVLEVCAGITLRPEHLITLHEILLANARNSFLKLPRGSLSELILFKFFHHWQSDLLTGRHGTPTLKYIDPKTKKKTNIRLMPHEEGVLKRGQRYTSQPFGLKILTSDVKI